MRCVPCLVDFVYRVSTGCWSARGET